MGAAKLSDDEFIKFWNVYKSCDKMAASLNLDPRSLKRRRRMIEQKRNITLVSAHESHQIRKVNKIYEQHRGRLDLGILNGSVIVFSDAHFWGKRTTAFQGLLWAIQEIKPVAVIANGDIFDGSGISRHPRIGYSHNPTVLEELKACTESMGEIEEIAKINRHNTKLVWCMGNHDSRFESFLAANAPQYEHVQGFSLRDHFPAWEPCWAAWVNEGAVVKHRYKNGIHATHNNAVGAGISIVTGHLHSLKVTPFTDYNGTRYGVDTGCLADTDGPQFADYLELNPTNWRSGFAILSFLDGKMLMPELVQKWSDGEVQFRGAVIDVSNF